VTAIRGRFWRAAFIISLTLVPAWSVDESAADLVRFLTYQGSRDGREAMLAGLSGCGQYEADHTAMRSLVRMGDSAVKELENALDSIQARGEKSEYAVNGSWLMVAYAKIRGRDAFPRFRRMLDDPGLLSFSRDLDASAAVSLALTSYVSGPRPLTRRFNCGRPQQPNDALDQLISAWEGNDRQWLDSSLTDSARIEFGAPSEQQIWANIRTEYAITTGQRTFSIGYRFETAGPWSSAEDPDANELDGAPGSSSPRAVLRTYFVDSAGKACGNREIGFRGVSGEPPSYLGYLVDEADLEPVLRLISACASRR
jgi:hypothetical protein